MAANPSHEDRGGFLKDEKIAAEVKKAERSARAKIKYYRFNLNVPTKTLEEPVIDMGQVAGVRRRRGSAHLAAV